MRKTWCSLSLALLLLTACAPAESGAPEDVESNDGVVSSPSTPEEASGWIEHIGIEQEHIASLLDGSPIPAETLPLYYKGNWHGQTWASLAEETGFAESDLRALNPQVREAADGTLSGDAPELLLSQAYTIPQTQEALLTVTVRSMPEAYRERSYQVPASLPRGAATALALSYYNIETTGQGFICEPSAEGDYRQVVSGARFVTFSEAETYFSTIFTEEALGTMMEPLPWRGEVPAAYYAEGEGDTLLIQGYPFDHIIPQSGYTHTEPEEQPDGSLKFAGICIVVTDEVGEPLPAGEGRLYYAPTVLVETEDDWRVQTMNTPF